MDSSRMDCLLAKNDHLRIYSLFKIKTHDATSHTVFNIGFLKTVEVYPNPYKYFSKLYSLSFT